MEKSLTYPFTLPPLPYSYDALEPNIDTETMHYHHDKHFATYINNLNQAIAPYPNLQKMTLSQILTDNHLPENVRVAILNNGGGVFNHTLFFEGLSPASENNHLPKGILLALINQTFGSFDSFKQIFMQNALSVFGSGWTCLALMPNGMIKIINLKNQDTILNQKAVSLILVDVWEHAYYLKYKNERKTYLENIWNVIKMPVLK